MLTFIDRARIATLEKEDEVLYQRINDLLDRRLRIADELLTLRTQQ